MNSNFKLRSKVEGPVCISKALKSNKMQMHRRINTEVNQQKNINENNVKKINLFQNRTQNPLADNKIIMNQQKNPKKDIKLNYSNSSIKTSNRIKSILVSQKTNKDAPKPVKSILTQPYEKNKVKISEKLVQKLFQKQQKNVTQQPKFKQSFTKKQSKSGQQRYSYDEIIGNGTFGVVYKGRDKQTLQVVAIKKVLQDKKYKNRQLEILKLLNHENVLKMKDAFFTQENSKEYLNVIMDYFPDTVYSFIKRYNRKNIMPNIFIKIYSYQLFRSLLYLRKQNICHRDIKPQNILLDAQKNKLVMCDFGSAKRLVAGQENISYICSRCYRAPELIFGATQYNTQIDMWSAGCVLVEMIICEPIFMAGNNIDQLVEIIRVLGTPSTEQVLEMNPNYDMTQFKFPKINSRQWKRVIKEKVDPMLIDLIASVMKFSPKQRLTPLQALQHPYFNQLRDEQSMKNLSNQIQIPNLFNFSKQECSAEEIQMLKPKWCR